MNKHVVLCSDNDLQDWTQDKLLLRAINRLVENKKTVWVAMPAAINQQKTDFNEVLQQKGIQAIKKTLEQAVLCDPTKEALAREDNTHLPTLSSTHSPAHSLGPLLALPVPEKLSAQAAFTTVSQRQLEINNRQEQAISQYLQKQSLILLRGLVNELASQQENNKTDLLTQSKTIANEQVVKLLPQLLK